jgi:hypothetical protein
MPTDHKVNNTLKNKSLRRIHRFDSFKKQSTYIYDEVVPLHQHMMEVHKDMQKNK